MCGLTRALECRPFYWLPQFLIRYVGDPDPARDYRDCGLGSWAELSRTFGDSKRRIWFIFAWAETLAIVQLTCAV